MELEVEASEEHSVAHRFPVYAESTEGSCKCPGAATLLHLLEAELTLHHTCPVSNDIHPGSHLCHMVSALLSLRDGFGAAIPDWFLLLH